MTPQPMPVPTFGYNRRRASDRARRRSARAMTFTSLSTGTRTPGTPTPMACSVRDPVPPTVYGLGTGRPACGPSACVHARPCKNVEAADGHSTPSYSWYAQASRISHACSYAVFGRSMYRCTTDGSLIPSCAARCSTTATVLPVGRPGEPADVAHRAHLEREAVLLVGTVEVILDAGTDPYRPASVWVDIQPYGDSARTRPPRCATRAPTFDSRIHLSCNRVSS